MSAASTSQFTAQPLTQPHLLDLDIAADEFEFLGQRDFLAIRGLQDLAQ